MAAIDLDKEKLKYGIRVFSRMFVCFEACKRGWLGGCRPLIGLDGCFLKSCSKGQVLSSVGRNGDDQIFQIAWVDVDKGNKANWIWFLEWLQKELGLGDGAHLTLMSEIQKGLVQAIKHVLPAPDHRWYARHVSANWSKKWRGREFFKNLWYTAWSSYEEEYEDKHKVLSELSNKAAQDLMNYPPQYWCRAFFSDKPKSYVVENNISKSFNAWIKEERFKPIVTMLEEIRIKTMTRLAFNKATSHKWINEWSPSCMEYYQDNKALGTHNTAIFNGDNGFGIGDGLDKHTVFLDRCLCACKAWDLTRIPCSHAIAAMYHLKLNPLIKISMYYHKSTFEKAYAPKMHHVPG